MVTACTFCVFCSTAGTVIVGTAVPSASASQPSLNISSPEFVPRGTFQHSICNPYSLNDDMNNKDYSSCDGYYLPQRFANIAVGKSARPPRLSYSASHLRDNFTQTVNLKMDACTGGTPVLMVDKYTNTPHYDEADGLHRAKIKAEAKVGLDMHNDFAARLNTTSQHTESSVQSLGMDQSLNNRPNTAESLPNRWADCWNQGQSPTSVKSDEKSSYLFRDANKNHTSRATNYAASNVSRRESSGLSFEGPDQFHGTVHKSSQLSMHQMHNSCDCMISNCPFASPTLPLGVNRNEEPEQTADESDYLAAETREPGYAAMQVNIVL